MIMINFGLLSVMIIHISTANNRNINCFNLPFILAACVLLDTSLCLTCFPKQSS